MTIKTQINGLPFEIEVPRGMDVEISEGKLIVKRPESASLFGMLISQNASYTDQVIPDTRLDAIHSPD